MSIKKMSKEELELMSHKDITYLLLEENGVMNTKDLFKKIVETLELPEKTIEDKIADYYMSLTTDKRFVLLEDGNWDLRNRHTSDKISKHDDEDEDDDDDEEEEATDVKEDIPEDDETDFDADDNYEDDDSEDLKDLIVIDEDELELEE